MRKSNAFNDDRGMTWFDLFPQISNGQVNLSFTYPRVIKAWHKHNYQTDYFVILQGAIKLGMVDDEEHEIKSAFLTPQTQSKITVPAGIWHGYKALGDTNAVLIYFCDKVYEPESPDEERKPWDWIKDFWEVEFK